MAQVVDYSDQRPNPADLAAHGYVGAARYLAPLPNLKVITGDEIASLHANGLGVAFVWETTAQRAAQGASAGDIDARRANSMADDLGVPDSVPIYYAVDFDADPASVVPYFDAVNDAGGRPVGGYGSFRVVEQLLELGLIVKAWQTAAWSRKQRSTRAHLFQRADAAANPPPGCDVNEVLQDDWGQWSPEGTDDVTKDEIKQAIREVLDEGTLFGVTNADGSPGAGVATFHFIAEKVRAIDAKLEPESFAAAIVAKLPHGSVDAALVEDAVKQALREGVG